MNIFEDGNCYRISGTVVSINDRDYLQSCNVTSVKLPQDDIIAVAAE